MAAAAAAAGEDITTLLLQHGCPLPWCHPLIASICPDDARCRRGSTRLVDGLLPPLTLAFQREFEVDRPVSALNDPILFRAVGRLGKGSFGEVLLVQYVRDPRLFFAAKRFVITKEECVPLGNGQGTSGTHTSASVSTLAATNTMLQCTTGGHEEWTVARRALLSSTTAGSTTTTNPSRSSRRTKTSLGSTSASTAPSSTTIHPSPYLLRYLTVFSTQRAHHLVLQLAAGGSLQDVDSQAGQATTPIWRRLLYLGQALHGLWSLHLRNIMHRDIKPANLMFCDDDVGVGGGGRRLCIGDFGISKDADGGATTLQLNASLSATSSSSLHRSKLTVDNPHTVIGTMAYAPPELLNYWGTMATACYGTAADVFSLGAVFYCWLAREDVSIGLVPGPQAMYLLFEGRIPTLVALQALAREAVNYDDDVDEVEASDGPTPKNNYGYSTTTVSLSETCIRRQTLKKQRMEGTRLLLIPTEVLQCIDAMMHKDPANRPSAYEALQMLQRAMLTSEGTKETDDPIVRHMLRTAASQMLIAPYQPSYNRSAGALSASSFCLSLGLSHMPTGTSQRLHHHKGQCSLYCNGAEVQLVAPSGVVTLYVECEVAIDNDGTASTWTATAHEKEVAKEVRRVGGVIQDVMCRHLRAERASCIVSSSALHMGMLVTIVRRPTPPLQTILEGCAEALACAFSHNEEEDTFNG